MTRFWRYVDRRGPDECWPWLGATRSQGHGQIKIEGRVRSAHAIAWEIENDRPIPEGAYALHRCNNPNCVNAKHIYPGTQAENIQTSVALKTHNSARKTHCKRGHEFTEANIYRKPSKPHVRNCRACIALRKGH